MQAANLTKQDVKTFEKAFEEIAKRNPKAEMKILPPGCKLPKDCIFKNKCMKNKRVK